MGCHIENYELYKVFEILQHKCILLFLGIIKMYQSNRIYEQFH